MPKDQCLEYSKEHCVVHTYTSNFQTTSIFLWGDSRSSNMVTDARFVLRHRSEIFTVDGGLLMWVRIIHNSHYEQSQRVSRLLNIINYSVDLLISLSLSVRHWVKSSKKIPYTLLHVYIVHDLWVELNRDTQSLPARNNGSNIYHTDTRP